MRRGPGVTYLRPPQQPPARYDEGMTSTSDARPARRPPEHRGREVVKRLMERRDREAIEAFTRVYRRAMEELKKH